MPRIPPSLLRWARSINAHVARLLPTCRDIRSAENELRWLKEHALEESSKTVRSRTKRSLLSSYVARRAKGEPLQYILGTEYFGELELKCRPGVLIPRQETAASISHLARLVADSLAKESGPQKLSVLDLCTGSGCIPLLFHNEFSKENVPNLQEAKFVGVDISQTALALARENHATQVRDMHFEHGTGTWRSQSLHQMKFIQADVLRRDFSANQRSPTLMEALSTMDTSSSPSFDILISNPPYISLNAFRSTTSPSVRRFEPKLALVPPTPLEHGSSADGDLFYPRLLHFAEQLNTKILLFEVADMGQAERVAALAVGQGIWDAVEIWRDDPGALPARQEKLDLAGREVVVVGEGHSRSVVAYRHQVGGALGAS